MTNGSEFDMTNGSELMEEGDLIFFKTDGGVQDILINQASYYTHVALHVGDGIIIDSDVFNGVHEHPLDTSLNYHVYKIRDLTGKERKSLIKEFRKLKGRKYDIFGAMQGWVVKLLSRKLGFHIDAGDQKDKKHHCSEAVSIALNNSGVAKISLNPENLMPDDIILSVSRLYRIG